MAIVSLLGAATFNTTSGTKTVTAVPGVGDLIVIVIAHTGNTSTAAPTDNNSGGGGTYTLVNTAVKAASADTMKVWVRNALITSATSTVFTHAPGATTGGGLVVLDVQGMDKAGATAIVRSGIQSNQAAAGTPAPNLGATPSITNAIISAVFNASNPVAVTARTNYLTAATGAYNTPTTGISVIDDDAGETSATITWGGTSATAFCSIALELDARVTHATTGTLTGQDSEIVGSADRQAGSVTHDTTGVLTGQDSEIVGSATRFAVHPTTGALDGGSAVIVGSAARSAGPVTHATTGALAGLTASIAGSAARTRQHATSGVLSGPNAIVVGSATRTRAHATDGVLSAANAIIVGSASRTGAATSHDTTGALTGTGSSLEGAASRASEQPEYLRGEGWGINHRGKQRSFKDEKLEKEKFRDSIEAALKPVTETKAKVVTVKGDVAVVTESQTIAIPATPKFDAQAVARMVVGVLQKQGIEAKRVREAEARRQARIALQEQKRRILKRKRDDEIILLM